MQDSIILFGTEFKIIVVENKVMFLTPGKGIFNSRHIPEMWKTQYKVGRIISLADMQTLESLYHLMSMYPTYTYDIEITSSSLGYTIQSKEGLADVFIIKKGYYPTRANTASRVYKEFNILKKMGVM